MAACVFHIYTLSTLLSAWTVFFFCHKTQECLVPHCPTGFQPNKQQTVKLFSILLPVTRCSINSHLRLSNVLRTGRGSWVLGLFCCTVGKKMSKQMLCLKELIKAPEGVSWLIVILQFLFFSTYTIASFCCRNNTHNLIFLVCYNLIFLLPTVFHKQRHFKFKAYSS